MLVHTMNEGRPNQESEGTTGLIKDEVDVNEHLSTVVPMLLQGEEVATAQKHHQEEGMELDLKIWSLLSDHLLENILVWLSLLSLFVLHSLQTMECIHVLPELPCNWARVPPLKQAWFLFHGDGKESVAFNPEDVVIGMYLHFLQNHHEATFEGLFT